MRGSIGASLLRCRDSRAEIEPTDSNGVDSIGASFCAPFFTPTARQSLFSAVR